MIIFNDFREMDDWYFEKYGDDWNSCGRAVLTESDERQYIENCYCIYERHYEPRPSFESIDDEQADTGRPYRIIEAIRDDADWDLEALPAYRIEFIDEDGGIKCAFPEEIFFLDKYYDEDDKGKWVCHLNKMIV